MIGDIRPVLSISDIPVMETEQWINHDFTTDKRIQFLPEAKLLVTIPATKDQLVLYRFDVEELLEKAGIDYLFVTSQPPAEVRRGSTFHYQLAIKSRKGGLKYKLESGPKGMAVSAKGKLTWQVPERTTDSETPVIVSICDASGQECFHAFTLSLRD
jgi:hypothetical protein